MSSRDHQDNFLSRWSRRKQQSDSDTETTNNQEAPHATPHPPSDTPQKAYSHSPATESKPNVETDHSALLTDADMPDIESLNEQSDYSLFMSPKVSESLRKTALRKLFQGEHFNLRDGLDDYDDDYTRFTPLGGIVTTDMKHQMQVEAQRSLEKSLSGDTVMTPATPKQKALASLRQFQPAPTGQVEYHSQGSVLIIGDSRALQLITQLPEHLNARIVLTSDDGDYDNSALITLQHHRSLQLQGWLGDFSLTLGGDQASPQQLKADLVVDFCTPPLMSAEIPPPGYFSTQHKTTDQIIEALTPLQGDFAKPRFFDYDTAVCAHSRSGLTGCTACIDACPTQAIISIGDAIQVEPHLCQGGGTCATACPTGAIRYNYPAPGFQVDQVRRLLNSYRDAGGENPILLFHARETPVNESQLSDAVIPYALEELASVGADLWSAALSFGASQILLLDHESTPALSRQHLRHQLSILNTQLTGLGYPDDVARLVPPVALSEDTIWQTLGQTEERGAVMPYFPPATQAGSNQKRQQWLTAMDHLYRHAPSPQEHIALPAAAPFGVIEVDKDACTLCMACATVCPAQALSGGTESPLLKLHPTNCVQCGLCETGCPENAITLKPLFISNREQRHRPIQLNEEQPFHCIDCGKPFAGMRMISTMLAKLQGHPMFSDERALNRLKKCEDCRVIDIVQDEQAMGQPGLNNPQNGSLSH